MHGMVGVVIPVLRNDGTRAVLKISWTHPGNVPEPAALAAWAGRGAVLLLERADESYAMLLERLGSRTLADLADTEQAVAAAGRVAHRLAIAAPPEVPRLAEVAGSWSWQIAEDAAELGQPLPRRITDAAIASVRELGADGPELLLHGDLHLANVLGGARGEPWLAIDPKGFAGDPAYDSVTLLRERWPELVQAPGGLRGALLRRLAVFAEAAEVETDRARRWAQARAVIAAHWGRRYGDSPADVAACDRIAAALE